MPVSEARSLARSSETVVVEPVRPEEDRSALVELALRLQQYSPCIGVEDAERPQCLLLDITGIAHFFGTEASMAERLGQELSERHFVVKIAIGDSVAAAWLAAHFLAPSIRPAVIAAGQLDRLLGRAGRRAAHWRNIRQKTSQAGNRHDSPNFEPGSFFASFPFWRRDQSPARSINRQAGGTYHPLPRDPEISGRAISRIWHKASAGRRAMVVFFA